MRTYSGLEIKNSGFEIRDSELGMLISNFIRLHLSTLFLLCANHFHALT